MPLVQARNGVALPTALMKLHQQENGLNYCYPGLTHEIEPTNQGYHLESLVVPPVIDARNHFDGSYMSHGDHLRYEN